jgi:tyrosyl-tRNA synthetase
LIKGGGARINDVAIADELHAIGVSALNSDGIIKLSAGRKRHALVKAV